jgi:hypothetical protein
VAILGAHQSSLAKARKRVRTIAIRHFVEWQFYLYANSHSKFYSAVPLAGWRQLDSGYGRVNGGKLDWLFSDQLEELSLELEIAIRNSKLAMWQANYFAMLIAQNIADANPEIVPLVTEGDRIQDRPLHVIARNPISGVDDLSEGVMVGTTSQRRIFFLRKRRPDLWFAMLRANIDTWLNRL